MQRRHHDTCGPHLPAHTLSTHSLQALLPLFGLHMNTQTLSLYQATKLCHCFWFLKQSADLLCSCMWSFLLLDCGWVFKSQNSYWSIHSCSVVLFNPKMYMKVAIADENVSCYVQFCSIIDITDSHCVAC